MARNNKSDLAQIARDAGLHTFEDSSGISNETAFARAQTAAVTHYYSEDTLRYFRCTVKKLSTFDGVVMGTICHQDVSHDHKKGFIVVVHDCGGWTIDRTKVDEHFSSFADAERAFWDILNAIDTGEVLRDVMKRELDKAKRVQREISKGLRKLPKAKP